MSENKLPSYFAAATDKLNRWDCSGGGVLQLIAEHILNDGGKLCAPVFADDFRSVEYVVTDDREDIGRIPEIPYIKCNAEGCFDEIKRCLDNGITVLFAGAPCEIKKIKELLKNDNKEPDKELVVPLYTIGLGCKGAVSSVIWKSWLESIEAGTVTGLRFGAKELDCSESIRIQFDGDREKIYNETVGGSWFTAYRNGLLTDGGCNKCSFSDADISLAVLPNNDRNLNDGKGATLVSVNNQKGERLFGLISQDILFKKEIPEDKAVQFTAVYNNPKKNEKAELFLRLCREYGYKAAAKKIGTAHQENRISYILDYHAGDGKPWSAADNEVWSRPILHDGYVVLKKCSDKWQRIFLPLDREMEKGKIYCYDIKFRAMTTSKDIYFQVTTEASNENTFTEGLGRTPSTEQWTRTKGKFTCIFGGHRYFDISGAVLTGSEKMMFIDWIRIWEE